MTLKERKLIYNEKLFRKRYTRDLKDTMQLRLHEVYTINPKESASDPWGGDQETSTLKHIFAFRDEVDVLTSPVIPKHASQACT